MHLLGFGNRRRCDAGRGVAEHQLTLDQTESKDAEFMAGMGCSFQVSACLFSERQVLYTVRSSPKEIADGCNPAKQEGVGPERDTRLLCPVSPQTD